MRQQASSSMIVSVIDGASWGSQGELPLEAADLFAVIIVELPTRLLEENCYFVILAKYYVDTATSYRC